MDPSPVQAPPLLHDVAVKTEERARVRSRPPKDILYTSPERTEIRTLRVSLAHTGPTNHPATAAGPTTTPARRPEVQRQVALAFCFFLSFLVTSELAHPYRITSHTDSKLSASATKPSPPYAPLLLPSPSRSHPRAHRMRRVTPDAHRIHARRPTRDRERAAPPSRNQVRRRFSPPTLLHIPILALSLFNPRVSVYCARDIEKRKTKNENPPHQHALRRRARLGASNPINVHASLGTTIDDDAHARPRSTVPSPSRPTSAPTPTRTHAGTLARALTAASGRWQWPGSATCPHQRARVFLGRAAWPSAFTCACARARACPRVPGQPRAVDARTGIICAWHPKRGTYNERFFAMTARTPLRYPENQTNFRKGTADCSFLTGRWHDLASNTDQCAHKNLLKVIFVCLAPPPSCLSVAVSTVTLLQNEAYFTHCSFGPFSANVMFFFPSLIVSWLFERHKRSERGVPIISYIVIYKRARSERRNRAIAKRAIETGRKKRGVVASTKTGNARIWAFVVGEWKNKMDKAEWVGVGVMTTCFSPLHREICQASVK